MNPALRGVEAGGLAAVIVAVVFWVLERTVFGDGIPNSVQGLADGLITAVVGVLVGWWASQRGGDGDEPAASG